MCSTWIKNRVYIVNINNDKYVCRFPSYCIFCLLHFVKNGFLCSHQTKQEYTKEQRYIITNICLQAYNQYSLWDSCLYQGRSRLSVLRQKFPSKLRSVWFWGTAASQALMFDVKSENFSPKEHFDVKSENSPPLKEKNHAWQLLPDVVVLMQPS